MNTCENRAVLKTADGCPLIVPEQSTHRIEMTLVDETGAAIPSAALITLTLTLYVRDDPTKILNGVTGTNILNTGRGAVQATSGLLVITCLPADNAVNDTTKDLEWHRALVSGTYTGGKAFKYEVDFPVRNLNLVP